MLAAAGTPRCPEAAQRRPVAIAGLRRTGPARLLTGIHRAVPTTPLVHRRNMCILAARRRPETPDGRREDDSEPVLMRSQLVGKDVITRTSGTRLGVVDQLWVDTSEWEVLALSVKPNLLATTSDDIPLPALRQVGDVLLVHDENAVARRPAPRRGLDPLIGAEVVSEKGVCLGKVRDFAFEPEAGAVARLVLDSFGLPLIPEGVIASSYAISIQEVVSFGTGRIVVQAGAESRIEPLRRGLLEAVGLDAPPWTMEPQYGLDYVQAQKPGLQARYEEDDEPPRYDEKRQVSGRRTKRQILDSAQGSIRIPLWGSSALPAEMRRDVDGGFGDREGDEDNDTATWPPQRENDDVASEAGRAFSSFLEQNEAAPVSRVARGKSQQGGSF